MGPREKTHRIVEREKKTIRTIAFQEEEAERKADYNKVAEMRYKEFPKLQKEIEEIQKN